MKIFSVASRTIFGELFAGLMRFVRFRLSRFFDRLVVGLDPFSVENAGLVDAFVGVGAEEIALRLQQIGRQTRRSVAIEITERRGKGGNRNTELDGMGNGDSPVVLGILEDVGEIGIEHEIVQRAIAFVSVDDAVQKFRADYATAAPNGGDVAEV